MDKVLSINDRLEDNKRKRHKQLYRHKAEALQRIVQCSSCQLSCSMCGSHFDMPEVVCPPASSFPALNLCESCRAEYNDFLEISKGKQNSDIFWHNEEWVSLWAAWLDYHKAIEKFRTSKEFKQLINESE